ncbi:unnamed protein product, partial [Meganyctiphanes norvegica]
SALNDEKDQLSRFRNILIFFTGEITRLSITNKKLKNVFENLAGRLVFIGWLCTYDQICCDTQYGHIENKENNDIPNDSKILSINPVQLERKAMPVDISQRVTTNHQKGLADADFESSEDKFITESVIEPINETEFKEVLDNTEHITEDRNSGREDFLLALLTESKMDEHMRMAVTEKLSAKDTWVITNGMNFPALNGILKSAHPKQMSIVIDSDPLSYPDFKSTILMITEKKIEFELFLNSQYSDQVKGTSDAWVNKDSRMGHFIGRLEEVGLSNLPSGLKSLHIAIDVSILQCLCKKLSALTNLDILGLQISLSPTVKTSTLPKLCYSGTNLSVSLVAPISDNYIPQVTDILAQLCPQERKGEFTSICLRETEITSTGMHSLLENLNDKQLSVSDSIRIWTAEDMSFQQKCDINRKAKHFDFGRVYIYDILSTIATMPKQIMKQETSQDTTENL